MKKAKQPTTFEDQLSAMAAEATAQLDALAADQKEKGLDDELAAMAAEATAQLDALLAVQKRPGAKKPVATNTRSEIRALIAANSKEVETNLYAFMERTIEDLVAGGIDHTRVANATLYAALCRQQQILGTAELINVLLKLAAMYERKLASSAQRDGDAAVH